ncbi:Aflatoxin biosynthesis regulatory protein [Penicillium argentinense]|uniref:Aflatoxin biosynthesis regulatory protein n=1 Tax=Penicillium argentinense TaxID=1131581 RepID=A0A9W9K2J8_9EURO|nr:Aflatoxin biosynthesis regulatory protein [Penicillium argentinense]KAJ5090733.1 Aflatoxin biosynthesis regulatory protein [Penicillium argentinense]
MRRVKKSRNGCARCKSKRVKCGEEKPHCNRCTRLGVRCPGYVQSLRWVTKYDEPSPGASSDGKAASPATSQAQGPAKLPSGLSEEVLSFGDANAGPPHNPDPSSFSLDGPLGLCDNLWDLPGSGSLPELTDLCPTSPITSSSAFTQAQEAVHDFVSSGDTTADLSHFLSLIGPAHGEEQGCSTSIYRDFSPSAIVRSYPPAPQQSSSRDFMSISRLLNNPSWTLIEYYFKEVAALFSSYDSQMNPFRTTVSRLWGSSLAMCRTMQSMAAATLVNDFPQFGPMGRKMRDEAVDIITREAVMDDKALLALLMLGQTASWHDPKDLGVSFFNLLRKQINTIGSNSHEYQNDFIKSSSNNYRFFEEALIYWEMLLSFVADNDMVFSDDSRASSMGESLVLQRVPHPWTGIARDTQFTVHEVGRLVRRERKRIRSRRFTSQEEITRAQVAIEKARELEERLLGLAHPTEAEIVSPGDDETPVWHLLTMAEVYRCIGLMQLYRVFPDLLRNRLPTPGSAATRDPFFPIDLDSMNMSTDFCDTHHNHNHTSGNPGRAHNTQTSPSTTSNTFTTAPADPEPDTDTDTESLYNNWLTEFAITTLSRLKTIPLESRTRCLQPLLLVAASSELRLPHPSAHTEQPSHQNNQNPNLNPEYPTNSNGPEDQDETPSISMDAIEVSRTRRFILGRLTSFMHVLPPKPINVCLKLVKEVWKRMDAGETDAYWIDIMIEKGWETTMG